MKAMKQASLLTIIGLIIAALGIISPIAWDWHKNRAAIELQCVSRDVLFQKSEGLDKLAITYNGISAKSLRGRYPRAVGSEVGHGREVCHGGSTREVHRQMRGQLIRLF